jgi:hypothetical protein
MPSYLGPAELIVLILVFVLPIYVGHVIARRKNRRFGWLWGLVLSWIGVLTVALLPASGRVCPRCAEKVKPAALVCKHCGTELPSQSVGYPNPSG